MNRVGLSAFSLLFFAYLGFAKGVSRFCYFEGCVTTYNFDASSVSYGLMALVSGLICLKQLLANNCLRDSDEL